MPLKKIATLFLAAAALFLTLCSCSGEKNIIKSYGEDGGIPAHTVRLYPGSPGDTRVASLMCRYDGTDARIGVADGPGSDVRIVYETSPNTLTYEITAGGGIIAFYELTIYNDGSAGYALKAVDTENGGAVHSPFKKTVSSDTVKQTRFLYVYDGYVYYLTEAALLGRCRVMRYSVKERTVEEFASFPFTENEATGGSSCTFISGRGGYLTCGVVDGSRSVLRTYDLVSGGIWREKALPYAASVVYSADLDPMTGIYALYYLNAQNEEQIGLIAGSDERITDVFTLAEGTFVNREEVRLYNDLLIFSLQDQSKQDDPYAAFRSVAVRVTDLKTSEYAGCFEILTLDAGSYKYTFDKKAGYSKILLSGCDMK